MMLSALYAVIFASLGAPASAGSLEQVKIDFMTPALAEGLLQVKQASPRWTYVRMNIYASDPFYEVRDASLRIDLRGSKSAGSQFSFSGKAGSQYLYFTAYPLDSQNPRRGYNMSGAQVNLSINPSGGGYSIYGWVYRKNIRLQATPYAGGGFSLWGQPGLNLNVSGTGTSLWVTGNVNLDQFDEPSLAALGAVLSVLNSMPPQAK